MSTERFEQNHTTEKPITWRTAVGLSLTSSLKETQTQHILGVSVRIFTIYLIGAVLAFSVYTVLWPDAPFVDFDTQSYLNVAQDVQENLHIDELALRPPGYPLFLALVGATSIENIPTLYFHLQLIMHFISGFFVITLLYQLRTKYILLYLAMLILFMPFMVVATVKVLSETSTAFLLSISLCCLLMWLYRREKIFTIIASQ